MFIWAKNFIIIYKLHNFLWFLSWPVAVDRYHAPLSGDSMIGSTDTQVNIFYEIGVGIPY